MHELWLEEAAALVKVNGEDISYLRLSIRQVRNKAAKGELKASQFMFSQLPKEVPAEARKLTYEEYMAVMVATLTQDDLRAIEAFRQELAKYVTDADAPWPADAEVEARVEFYENYEHYREQYNMRVPAEDQV